MVYFSLIDPFISPKRTAAISIYVWKVSRVGLETACCRPWPTYGLLVFPLCSTEFLNRIMPKGWADWVGYRTSFILLSFIARVIDPNPNPIGSETFDQVGSGIFVPDSALNLDPRLSGLIQDIKLCMMFANLYLENCLIRLWFHTIFDSKAWKSYYVSTKLITALLYMLVHHGEVPLLLINNILCLCDLLLSLLYPYIYSFPSIFEFCAVECMPGTPPSSAQNNS